MEGHPKGQGFSSVYDASTGKVLAKPSPEVDIEGATLPDGWVTRNKGHAKVSEELGGDSTQHWGFAVILQRDGTLNIRWRSRTLNPRGLASSEDDLHMVPENLRPKIIQAIETATGRKVNNK
jgi:hypothetical protein